MNVEKTILAADIGGTHARLGLVDVPVSQTGQMPSLQLAEYTKYRCADFFSLEDIVSEFLGTFAGRKVSAAIIASAGYFEGDVLYATNLPWQVNLAKIKACIGSDEVYGLNDYEALANGTFDLPDSEVTILNSAGKSQFDKARVVLGPGTGLGAAVIMPNGASGAVTLTTEAGNAGFSPACNRDHEIHKILEAKIGYVAVESVLSGPGLVNIYNAIAEMEGEQPKLTRPSQISAAALEGSCPIAVKSLDAFCEILGSVCGDLALTYGARGGVYLAGGILPKFKNYLVNSQFMDRFLSKGKMKSYLENIPVQLINHGSLGVMGAANWYVNKMACSK